jgi:hypothetical protein
MEKVTNIFNHESDAATGVKAAAVETQPQAAAASEAVPAIEMSAAPVEASVVESSVVESSAVEARPENSGPERLSAEERGREILASAGERVGNLKNSLASGAGRLWERIKSWPGKAARFAGRVAVKGAAMTIGAIYNSSESARDAVSEMYNKGVEKWNQGKEYLEGKAQAAAAKIEATINAAGAKFQERLASLSERFSAYMKKRQEIANIKQLLRQKEFEAARILAGGAMA